MRYSVVIPVYNRPDEVDELLESLTRQSFTDFEVLIIEDGSENDCKKIVEKYKETLAIRYYKKENSGQGFSRNYGFERANGEYLVVFDSDCIVPDSYFASVEKFLESTPADCWGGPDRAHSSFTVIQKAINYSMTSQFTTGGIRGNKQHLGTFHPRSFNMGISREVFEKTGGYKLTRMGEDIEFSLRIIEHGFKSVLIEDAYVYHKRRTNLLQFYKQLHFFGRARINIGRFYPDEVKAIHWFPLLFLIGLLIAAVGVIVSIPVIQDLWKLYLGYGILLFAGALKKEKNPIIALFAVLTSFIQLSAYGVGFATEWVTKKGSVN